MSRRMPHPTRLAAAFALLLAVTACGSGGGSGDSAGGGSGPDTLRVLAAASLTEAFTELGDRFEEQHPGVDVQLAFDSSATLATQVVEGAPADVLATADATTMQQAVDAGATAGDPEVFATNEIVLVVPRDNPAGIAGFADIDDPDVDYVVCVESAPCGSLAAELLAAAGVQNDPRSEEVDVKAVLSKVQLDEADAGLVYATDAQAAGPDVRALQVPGSDQAVTDYPLAVLAGSSAPELARQWRDLVLSDVGRRVLGDAGFGAP